MTKASLEYQYLINKWNAQALMAIWLSLIVPCTLSLGFRLLKGSVHNRGTRAASR